MLPYNIVPWNNDAILCLWLWYGLFPSPHGQLLLSLEAREKSTLSLSSQASTYRKPYPPAHLRWGVLSLYRFLQHSAYHYRCMLWGLLIYISDFPLESKGPRRMVSYLYLHLKHLPQFLARSKSSIPVNIFVGLIIRHFKIKCWI